MEKRNKKNDKKIIEGFKVLAFNNEDEKVCKTKLEREIVVKNSLL